VTLGFSFAIPAASNPLVSHYERAFSRLDAYQLFENARVELALFLTALIIVLVLDIQAFPMLFELGIAVFAKLLDAKRRKCSGKCNVRLP
jgi:hypothetical protein